MVKKPSTRGGSLTRSETVTVRLDPRLNYLCELAARAQRRTKSSFIEAVIADRIKGVTLDSWDPSLDASTIGDCADELWHIRDYQRLISLAFRAPNLLTFEEQEIWAVICEHGYFWKGYWTHEGDEEVWHWKTRSESLDKERVGENWRSILAVAQSEESKDVLPDYNKRREYVARGGGFGGGATDLDDEIPF